MLIDYSWVRGFNYQPGYAFNTYEACRFFNPEIIRKELALGKKAFPKFNVVRWWLSYDAFRYEEDRQVRNFETFLQIADSLGLKVVPCLTNRWHDRKMDNGGVYLDQLIPEASWCSENESIWQPYIDKMVAPHRNDERILLWDTCNEPFSYGAHCPPAFKEMLRAKEYAWLQDLYNRCKAAGLPQPVSMSPCLLFPDDVDYFGPFTDVFLVHTYAPLAPDADYDEVAAKHLKYLEDLTAAAKAAGKGLLCTECCWGSLDDAVRVRQIELTLGAMNKVGLGFLAYALCYSSFADLHNPEDGVVSIPGNLCFLNKDGSVRPGHEVFNNY